MDGLRIDREDQVALRKNNENELKELLKTSFQIASSSY